MSTWKNTPVGSATHTDGRATVSFGISSVAKQRLCSRGRLVAEASGDPGEGLFAHGSFDTIGSDVMFSGCRTGIHLVLVSKFRACPVLQSMAWPKNRMSVDLHSSHKNKRQATWTGSLGHSFPRESKGMAPQERG